MKKTVLIVDDSAFMRTTIQSILVEMPNIEIVGLASSGKEAIEMAFDLEPDLITLDNILPDMVGLEILEAFSEDELPSKVLMVSAVGQQQVVNEAIEKGASEYLVKPFDDNELVGKVNAIIDL